MPNPLTVSVIIPAFNESKNLPVILKALNAQTVKPLQIIVIDNNSTDNTLEVAKSLGAITLFEKERGTNNALETGRLTATGDLVARVDADCIPNPDWIERIVARFQDPKIVGLTGPYDYYDGGWFFRKVTLAFQRYIYSATHHMLDFLNHGAIMIGGNSISRRITLEKIGGFDRKIIFYGDDTDLAKKLSKEGMVFFDKDLIMKSSARRFKEKGLLHILWKYMQGFFKMTFRAKR